MSPGDRPTTVSAYLAALPADRRKEVERVRKVIKKNLPAGYKESIGYGMLAYVVPLERYPDTYNKQPLVYVALASQKSYLSLHLVPVYGDKALLKKLEDGFDRAGKKLNIGKACVRFKSADDLALDAVGAIVAAVPLERYVALAKAARRK
jgi:hypothetical protein